MVAAADSGLDAAMNMGVSPQLICGDMDSLDNRGSLKHFADAEVVEVGREKDETDTELGLRLLSERGYSNTLLCGGGASGRFDHELGVLWTFFRRIPPRGWMQPLNELVHVRSGDRIRFSTEPGTVLSCFPASDSELFVFESEGLKWPLHQLDWSRRTVGISNETVSSQVTLGVRSGGLLVVRPHRIDKELNGSSLLEALWRG